MAWELEITDISLMSYHLGIEVKQTKRVFLFLKKAMYIKGDKGNSDKGNSNSASCSW